MNKNVIELVIFQTKEGVTEQQFLQLFHALNEVLEKDMKGFIKRSIKKDSAQEKWMEMIWWESMETAQAALKTLFQIEAFQQYCTVIENDKMIMFHLEDVA